MEESKITSFLTSKKDVLFGSKPFSQDIIEEMIKFPDKYLPILENLPMRQPSTTKLIAMVPGIIGFDCFYLGDIKRGIIKYFTFGGLGILWLKDLKNAEERCREYNRKKLIEVLRNPAVGVKMIENNAKTKSALKVVVAVAPELVKGAKDVQNTMYVN